MNRTAPARRGNPRLVGFLVACLLVALAAVVVSPAVARLASWSSTGAGPVGLLLGGHRSGLGEADGVVAGRVTVFDDTPAVSRLDHGLLAALRRAAADASRDHVQLYVNSGWRSAAYQDQLLSEAVTEHDSRAQAARWVATAKTSPHVSGDAVDLGPFAATAWLSVHGAAYGLCQIYGNEPWHYELRPDATRDGCPPAYADPTHGPRMRP